MGPRGRFVQNFDMLGGLVIYVTRLTCPTSITIVVRSHLMGTHRHSKSFMAVIWPISLLMVVITAPGSRDPGDFSRIWAG